MPTSATHPDGTIVQAPNGSLGVISRGRVLLVTKKVLQDDGLDATKPVAMSQADFDSWPGVTTEALTVFDTVWDSGLSGVNPGETGHLASFKGRLTVSTGQVLGECRALNTTWLGGFHVSFTAIFADADGFPVASSIPPLYVRLGVDGRWVGVSDRTVPWVFQLSPADAKLVSQVQAGWTWDPDSFQKILDKWVQTREKLDKILSTSNASAISRLFLGTATTPRTP